ncbi:phosphopentomutase [Verrucomicrobiota bacterium]
MKVVLIILDSVGIGEAPDAGDFGDIGANTLTHSAAAVGGLSVPTLQRMGLGNIPPLLPSGLSICGVQEVSSPIADFGAMRQVSLGKDTITGHWEIAGLELKNGFHCFPPGPPSFPPELVQAFEAQTGRKLIGNKAASGTAIIDELGPRQIEEGSWIVYTSADSVFQIAAHEEVVPLRELYQACEMARELCNAYHVGRVIARPYAGSPGSFRRTENRRDYSYPLPESTILDRLTDAGIPVYAVGKIEDIFNHRGITRSFHEGNTLDCQAKVADLIREDISGLIFANFIDFDMLYGHRRDPVGYAKAIEQTDAFLETTLSCICTDDTLILTADHGNDPTFKGTDHTREYVPLLVYRPRATGTSLGIRHGFFDLAQSLASMFGISPMPRGVSFIAGR